MNGAGVWIPPSWIGEVPLEAVEGVLGVVMTVNVGDGVYVDLP